MIVAALRGDFTQRRSPKLASFLQFGELKAARAITSSGTVAFYFLTGEAATALNLRLKLIFNDGQNSWQR
jgi:hypothetical protein